MSLSDDPISPTEKNRASMSQEPRESLQDSSFLRSKETEKKSHTSISQEALKNQTSMSQEAQKPFVPPMNTDEEVLKSLYDSYREYPTYYDCDNMSNPSGGMFEGSLDSAGNMGTQIDLNPTQMNPTSGDINYNNVFFGNNYNNVEQECQEQCGFSDAPEMPRLLHNPGHHIGVGLRPDMEEEISNISIDGIDLAIATLFADSTEDSQLPYDSLQGLGMQGEGYGTNTSGPFEYKSDIAFGSFGSIESMMNAKREREKIEMIPTPRTVNRDLWTIKKILGKTDVSPWHDILYLSKRSFVPFLEKHLPKADFQRLVPEGPGIRINVYDHDTETTHELCLALRRGYHLKNGWRKGFVERRRLRQGQEIGFFWDSSNSRLHFSVISS